MPDKEVEEETPPEEEQAPETGQSAAATPTQEDWKARYDSLAPEMTRAQEENAELRASMKVLASRLQQTPPQGQVPVAEPQIEPEQFYQDPLGYVRAEVKAEANRLREEQRQEREQERQQRENVSRINSEYGQFMQDPQNADLADDVGNLVFRSVASDVLARSDPSLQETPEGRRTLMDEAAKIAHQKLGQSQTKRQAESGKQQAAQSAAAVGAGGSPMERVVAQKSSGESDTDEYFKKQAKEHQRMRTGG